MNEADTRAELIEKQLEDAGWKSADTRIRRERRINAQERPGGMPAKAFIADFVLGYKNVDLAVVEAKSVGRDVSDGVTQATMYATKLRLPTAFVANGKQIYQIDLTGTATGLVDAFPTPQELWERTFGKSTEWMAHFNKVSFEYGDRSKKARYYQEAAVNHALQAIAKGDKRQILLNLATGTGKTFIAFQIAWKLYKSRWTLQKDRARSPRILFITDRNILADQAYTSFGAFESARIRVRPKDIAKQGEAPTSASVFITLFQTLMSQRADGSHYFADYDPDFFDLVIIDECHRGAANDDSNWRAILDHFADAVHLGLTATPRREENRNTYEYFGEPVFTYSLNEGVEDGFLTPFRVKRIESNIDDYVFTSDDKVLDGESKPGEFYAAEKFNISIEIIARERKRVQDMLSAINPSEKTLVFCVNQAHAGLISRLINEESGKGGDYCVRVTANDGEIGDAYFYQFQRVNKTIPTIITTSQKLATGVDAANVRNIVIMRTIKSMVDFKQVIGRGTRLCEDKRYFTIIDFVGACKLFEDPEWDGKPMDVEGDDDNDDLDKPIRKEHAEKTGDDERERKPRTMLRIELSDEKERELYSTTTTKFFIDGESVSEQEFIERAFNTIRDKMPHLLESAYALRKLWANPQTRKEIAQQLETEGFDKEQLVKLQEIIDAGDGELLDVLEFIVNAKLPTTRIARVEKSKKSIFHGLPPEQCAFVMKFLFNYIQDGDDELALDNLDESLEAQYGSTIDAQDELGSLKDILKAFVNFQQHLYNPPDARS